MVHDHPARDHLARDHLARDHLVCDHDAFEPYNVVLIGNNQLVKKTAETIEKAKAEKPT